MFPFFFCGVAAWIEPVFLKPGHAVKVIVNMHSICGSKLQSSAVLEVPALYALPRQNSRVQLA